MSTKHTPTPWRADYGDLEDGLGAYFKNYVGPDGKVIRVRGFSLSMGNTGQEEPEANAAFIVLAVNAHDDLVEALRSCVCPRPAKNRPDDETIGSCVDSGNCGCCCGAPLIAKASPAVNLDAGREREGER